MRLLAISYVLVACGKGGDPPAPTATPPTGAPPTTSGTAPPASGDPGIGAGAAGRGPAGARLEVIAELRGEATLVAGTRRFAILAGTGASARWFQASSGTIAEGVGLGEVVAGERERLGPLAEVHLGATAIVAGGEDHHEEHVRLGAPPRAVQPVTIDGLVTEVATVSGGHELWLVDHEIRTELVAVTNADVRRLAALPHLGPDAPGRSPVSAKLCAVPRVIDLASNGVEVGALVTECSSDAPIRIASYRWPAPGSPTPAATIVTLPPASELELAPERLAIMPGGAPILIGRRGARLAIGRVAAGGRVTVTVHLANVSRVTAAIAADDDAVWTLTLGAQPDRSDAWIVARDGVVVPVASPAGEALRPEQLAFDEALGVVVLARRGDTRWLLAERAPAGPPLAITAR